MASAVQSLIAISDAMDLPRKKHRRFNLGNILGPWVPNENWIPRKNTSSGRHKKTHTKGREAVFKRLSQPKTHNWERSSYEEEKDLHDQQYVTDFHEKFGIDGRDTPQTEEDISFPYLVKRPSTVSGDFEANESFHDKSETHVTHSSNRTALPALITLTTDTGDERAIFGLGKQLELNTNKQNKLSVSKRKSASRNVASAPSGENNNLPPIHNVAIPGKNKVKDNHLDVPNGKSDALRRAFAKRNPVPPCHNYEDISQHMKFYRMNHTVMGTGRFSLANKDDIERNIKPIQWVDVFPNRPLNDPTPVTDVPVFRLSSADFRIHTGLQTPTFTVPPARPSTPTFAASNGDPSFGSAGNLQGEFGISPKNKRLHLLEKVSEVDLEECDETKLPKTPWKKYENEATTSYTVYNDSIRPAKEKDFDKNRGLYAYKEYLKARDKTRKMKESNGTDDNVATNSNKNNKHRKREKDRRTELKALTRSPNLSPVRERNDEFESEDDSDSNLIINTTRDKNAKKKYRYPKAFYKRRVLANMSLFGRQNPKATKLIVDAHRLSQSVDEKIVEGEENLRRSFEDVRQTRQKMRRIPLGVPSASTEPTISDSVEETTNTGHDKSQDRCASGNDTENDDRESEPETSAKFPQRPECNSSLGLVTAYDFKGYIQSMRTTGKNNLDEDLTNQQEKIISEGSKNRPESVSETPKLLLGKNKKWNPKESRVKTALRRKSRELSNPEEFHRSSSSASLKFKPTSPATSAFVIAAPPPSVGIDKRTVVLPLNDFMQMAMGSREQSFSDWTNSLNSSAKIGGGFGGRAGTGRKSRDEGLLRVVSFATPVNQFIFAKKITAQGSSDLRNSPFLEEQESSSVDKYLSRMHPNKFRLKLSDFGLEATHKTRKPKEKDRKGDEPSNCFDDTKDYISTGVNTKPKLPQSDNDNNIVTQLTETESNMNEDNQQAKEDTGDSKIDTADIEIDSACEITPENASNNKKKIRLRRSTDVTSLKRSPSNLTQEAHACLRREVLRLIEEKRAKSASSAHSQNSKDQRSIWSSHDLETSSPSGKDLDVKSEKTRKIRQVSNSATVLRKGKHLNPTPMTPPSTPQLTKIPAVGHEFTYDPYDSYGLTTSRGTGRDKKDPICPSKREHYFKSMDKEKDGSNIVDESIDIMDLALPEKHTRSRPSELNSRQCLITRRSSSRSSDDPLTRPKSKTVRFSSQVTFADED